MARRGNKGKATCKLETNTPLVSVSFYGTPHLPTTPEPSCFCRAHNAALYSLPTSCLLGVAPTVESKYEVPFVGADKGEDTSDTTHRGLMSCLQVQG